MRRASDDSESRRLTLTQIYDSLSSNAADNATAAACGASSRSPNRRLPVPMLRKDAEVAEEMRNREPGSLPVDAGTSVTFSDPAVQSIQDW